MHQTIAFRTAYGITRSNADAEDAAQQGFLKAFQALDRFRSGEPFRPWLLAIVANEAFNRRRAAARRSELTLRAAGELRSEDAVASPEADLLDRDRAAKLVAAIDRLGDDHRLVIVCRYLLELSEEETAAVLAIPVGTVKSRASRALERLRHEVGDDG